MNDNQNKIPSSNRNGLLIGLIVVLLLINALQFYLSLETKKELESKQITIEQKVDELKKAGLELDSMKRELQFKIREVEKLGGDTASLAKLLRSVENDLKNYKSINVKNRKQIAELRSRIEAYELQLVARDQEIEKLKQERDQLFADNKKLKSRIIQKEDSISKLAQTSQKLAEQVNIASFLRAEDIRVSIIDAKGREREDDEYRAKRINKLKVTFKIADNKVARVETKEVYMRITDPEGQILYDIATGGGTFELGNKESPYTSKLSFLFDNKQPVLSFIWEKGSLFKSGTHDVELFCEGQKIGSTRFTVK
jgi:DNA repair exonuclease SbcCD ATPase subunit